MRYLAIDYGFKRIGLAICDPAEQFVSPLCQLPRNPQNPSAVIQRIRQLIDENHIDQIVVGLPLNMDDSEGPQAQKSRTFADQLKKITDRPIHLHDERLSSAAADDMLQNTGFTTKKRKQRRDMLAACAILQDFLDRKKNHANQ